MVLYNLFKLSFLMCGVIANIQCPRKQHYNLEVLYQWTTLNYKWPPYISRSEMERQGKYIPENNAIFALESFHGEVFVCVARGSPATNFRDATGVPATLNKVVTLGGNPFLEPYPSWDANKIGNCNGFQNAAAIKIDKSTGLLWVVDVGTVNRFPVCNPKLVVIDVRTGTVVREHVFSKSVFNSLSGFISDIALGQFQGHTRYAFMADILQYKLLVYDFTTDKSWFIKDKSMQFDSCGSRLVSGNNAITTFGGIRSITVSPDSKYVYYNAVGSFSFYQIPLSAIVAQTKQECTEYIRNIGETPLQIMFMSGGQDNIYFADFTRNAIIAWDRTADVKMYKRESKVKLRTYKAIARDEGVFPFVNAFALDDGYLYFLSNNVAANRLGTAEFNDPCRPNFIIGRVFVNDYSPLQTRPKQFTKNY